MKKSVDIAVDLAPLLGTLDQNLLFLEKTLNVDIDVRERVIVSGAPKGVRKAISLLLDYEKLALQDGFDKDAYDFGALLSMVVNDPNASLFGLAAPGKTRPRGKAMVRVRNESQAAYLMAIDKNDMVFGVGPAGTGKTYLAVAAAVSALQEKSVERLVLIRPIVEAGEKLGFLPGGFQEKVDPYLRPLYDALFELMGPVKVKQLIEKGTIEIAPLAYMRGRTIKDSFILADEAQNATVEQMKMLVTRLGEGSKMVINGDVTQVDLPRGVPSGLDHATKLLVGVEGIGFHEFNDDDVVRHPLVQRIVRTYMK